MRKLIALIALTLISGGSAIAADKDKPMRETTATFEALDQNRDQRISQSEAAGDVNIAAQFTALDANGDGTLTKREFTAGAKSEKPEPRNMPNRPMPEPYTR